MTTDSANGDVKRESLCWPLPSGVLSTPSTSPTPRDSPTTFKPEPLDLSFIPGDPYDYLFKPYDSDEDEFHTVRERASSRSSSISSSLLSALQAKCELNTDDDTEDDGTSTPPARKKRMIERWGTPEPNSLPGSLVPNEEDTQPRYSPTHPDYSNRVYYEALTRCEEEEREIDRAYQQSPFQHKRCRFCQSTTMCAHCCSTDNNIWAFREGHRIQSRAATTQSVLTLLESHVRQLRNEGGIEEATTFISRAKRTLDSHQRTMTSSGMTNYTTMKWSTRPHHTCARDNSTLT
jgi:hypothetical protein